MDKERILLLVLFLISNDLFGQHFEMGAIVEAGYSKMDGFHGISYAPLTLNPSGVFAIRPTHSIRPKLGLYLGVNHRFWYVKPAVFMVANLFPLKRDYDYYGNFVPYYHPPIFYDNNRAGKVNNFQLIGWNIPVVFGHRFFHNTILLEGGPSITLSKANVETSSQDIADDQNVYLTSFKEQMTSNRSFNYGYQIGTGYKHGTLLIMLKYEQWYMSWVSNGRNSQIERNNFSRSTVPVTMNSFLISIIYRFQKSK